MGERRIGHYQLERRLALGGMAEVWLARTSDGSPAVVKWVLPHLAANPALVEMFLHEARIAALLQHPNIVRVFESGTSDNQPYIAMEYVDGSDLSTLLKRVERLRSRVPLPVALRIARDVSEALQFTHHAHDTSGDALNLVHRDVSASNVMISSEGRAKLLDFGIVKARDVQLTEPGTIKGKYAFMSPEQVAGTPLDARSDLFSLGLMLYEMLSGVRPYRHESEPATYQAALLGRVRPLSNVWPDAPLAVEALLSTALQFERTDRFESLGHFAEALDRAGPMADHAAVARWGKGLSHGAPLAPEADSTPYLAEKSLDASGQLQAPVHTLKASDFDAPDEGALELSRQVTARSSVQLPNTTGRPSAALKPLNTLELPPEKRSAPAPAKPPAVLPTLAATPVQPSTGVPLKAVLLATLALLTVGLTGYFATREKAPPPPIALAPAPPEPTHLDAGTPTSTR